MNVSKQLIHLRSVKGISQEELASLMNVTRQSVSKWETDQSTPDADKLVRLSEIFGVTTDYLLKGIESDPMDMQSAHTSKAGADMSAEVNEILTNVHSMSTKKRGSIGAGIFIGVAVILLVMIWGACKIAGLVG